MADYVYGTADELRALAALHAEGQPEPLAAAHAEQDQRVEALRAHYPGVPVASLAGRVFCTTPAGAPAPPARARCWNSIRDQGIGADLYMYGPIGEWGISAAWFVQDLNSIAATELTLHLSSEGGEVFDGLVIYNKLRDHPAHLTVRIDGLAASIASVIAMAGDKVIVNRKARMMIHDASGLVAGNAADMLAMADVLDGVSDDLAGIYSARAGGTPASWRKQMKAETWFSAEAAVTAGLADEAVSPAAIPDTEQAAAYAARQVPIIDTVGSAGVPGPTGQGRGSPVISPPGPDHPDDRYLKMAAFVAAQSEKKGTAL